MVYETVNGEEKSLSEGLTSSFTVGEDGKRELDYEIGTYGVSTSQLAMEPQDGSRSECQVIDGEKLKLSVLAYDGAGERTMLDFVKAKKRSRRQYLREMAKSHTWENYQVNKENRKVVEKVLEIENLKVEFPGESGKIRAVEGINLFIEKGKSRILCRN